MQHSGSFKARGAFANLLTREVPEAGVVAASGGNHGAAVAYAAMVLQLPAKIFIPAFPRRPRCSGSAIMAPTSSSKATAMPMRSRPARHGSNAPARCRCIAFDQDETMLGQGTLGIELDEQAAEIDTLLASVGGGGH